MHFGDRVTVLNVFLYQTGGSNMGSGWLFFDCALAGFTSHDIAGFGGFRTHVHQVSRVSQKFSEPQKTTFQLSNLLLQLHVEQPKPIFIVNC
jgi:hypothetical protein